MGESVEEGERMMARGPRRNCVRVWNLRGSCHMQRIAQKATNCWRLPTTRKLSFCISPHVPWILPKPMRTEGHDRFSRFEGNRQLGDLCGTASMESCRAVGTIGYMKQHRDAIWDVSVMQCELFWGSQYVTTF